ncbi:hypothetical protein AAF712_014195 [Marasmius tenuissimus]|uniref:KOW domain-containing protein n=1 Tax=Marasmius tenuissimus TaxID=585030 RepID=A0ABR2ZDM9_9AGAR
MVSSFLDIEAHAETDEDELEDEWGEDLHDQNDGPIHAPTLSTSASSTEAYAYPREYRKEFEGVISRYGSDSQSRDNGEAGPSGPSQLSTTPGNGIGELRSVMGPVLMRNPNPDIAAVMGMEEEVRAAKTQAERDFQWAKEEGILVEGTTAEDFLRPPTKRLRNEPSTFERAARGQMTSKMRGWEKWTAKQNQPAPEENWAPSRPLAPGEWVKVTAGTYAGDEGMVFDENGTSAMSSNDLEYTVFLVLRLAPAHMEGVRTNDKKRKRTAGRWPPRPFDPKEYVTAQLGDKGKNKANGEDALYTYNKMTFSNGLLIKSYRSTRLIPLEEKGIVQERTDDHFLINFGPLEDGSDDVRPVSERRLRKVVSPGDYVHVLLGPFVGRGGSVAEKHGPLLAILEKNDTSGKRFLVNRNCVRREKASFYRSPAVPWLDKEVTIELGQHAGCHGVVKDVALGPYSDCFLLSLFIPELECSAKIEDTNVFLKGTRMHLWEFYPPENAAWNIDSRVRGIRSGPTPWKQVQVAVIGGNHKGLTGVVRDVFRTQKPAATSGLELDVELDVIRAGSGLRCERIYYDHVRECGTGKPLHDFRPLFHNQAFFAPNAGFKMDKKRLRQHKLPIVALKAPNPLTQAAAGSSALNDLLLNELNRIESTSSYSPDPSTSTCPPDPILIPPDDLPSEVSQAGTPEPELSWGPMDVWHPCYETHWQILSGPMPPSPRSMSPVPPSPTHRRLTIPQCPPPTISHWIYHERLAAIPIDVEITGGKRCTKDKKYGVYVSPILGEGLVRDQRKASHHDIHVRHVSRPQRRPNKDALAVVIPQANPHDNVHFGKLVRFVDCFFDGPRVAVYRRWICAVVNGMDQTSTLTGETIVLPITDVEAVKQPKEVSDWAKNTLMTPVQEYASSRDTSENSEGERSYEDITAVILGQKKAT